MKDLVIAFVVVLATVAEARHESWVNPQRKSPPAEALTNMPLYLEHKWRTDCSDAATGLKIPQLREGVRKIDAEFRGREPWPVVKARMFDYLALNMAVGFSEFDCFPAFAGWDRYDSAISGVIRNREQEIDEKYCPELYEKVQRGRQLSRFWAYKDYNHSAPDWDVILKLGFTGMKARADRYAAERIGRGTPEQDAFYRSEAMTAATCLRFVERLRDLCPKALARERESLERLAKGAPETAFDVMQFTFLYFVLSEHVDKFQVRTLGNIDRLWWPYYQADLAAGRTTEAEFREQFRHFIWQFGSIDNYWGHPMYLGGTKADGTTEYNPLSMIILDVIDQEGLATPKFQIKWAANTPKEIRRKTLDMLRRHRPLVLMSEQNMARSMKPMGLSDEECRKLLIWGCFEYLPAGTGNCTSGTDIILPEPFFTLLEDVRRGKFTAATFEEFKEEYFRRLRSNVDDLLATVNTLESHLADINPSICLSLTIDSALEKGEDAFATGMIYNYTAINECGFATTVDSLLAVKEFVFDRGEYSLKDFAWIVGTDWDSDEELHLRVKRSRLKWGSGNREADEMAKELADRSSAMIVGRPNARGGKYVYYGLQSRAFIREGMGFPPTADGRRMGEFLSKNMAPSIGAEYEGITGAIRSYAAIRPENFPCGSIFDVMISPSTVGGEKELEVFENLVEVFFRQGGVAMNITVISSAELKDAQAHPEKYENLQVRVAGWNVRWNDIPKKEQDDFIRRIEQVERN